MIGENIKRQSHFYGKYVHATCDGYGNTVAASGSTSSPYQFGATSGYRGDGDVGIMQVGARYYDPSTGNFLTRDTDLNQLAYVYCGDDPVNKVDPSGHWSLSSRLQHDFVYGGALMTIIAQYIPDPRLKLTIGTVGIVLATYGADPKPVDIIVTGISEYMKSGYPFPYYNKYSDANLRNKYLFDY